MPTAAPVPTLMDIARRRVNRERRARENADVRRPSGPRAYVYLSLPRRAGQLVTSLLDRPRTLREVRDLYELTGSLAECEALLRDEARYLALRGTRDIDVAFARLDWIEVVVEHDLRVVVEAVRSGDLAYDPELRARRAAERAARDRRELATFAPTREQLDEDAVAAVEIDAELDDHASADNFELVEDFELIELSDDSELDDGRELAS